MLTTRQNITDSSQIPHLISIFNALNKLLHLLAPLVKCITMNSALYSLAAVHYMYF
jgi:hypothetical protein